MSDEKVPFLDLVRVHRRLQDEFVNILKTALSPADSSVVLWFKDLNRTLLSFANHGFTWVLAAAQMPYGLR